MTVKIWRLLIKIPEIGASLKVQHIELPKSRKLYTRSRYAKSNSLQSKNENLYFLPKREREKYGTARVLDGPCSSPSCVFHSFYCSHLLWFIRLSFLNRLYMALSSHILTVICYSYSIHLFYIIKSMLPNDIYIWMIESRLTIPVLAHSCRKISIVIETNWQTLTNIERSAEEFVLRHEFNYLFFC